MTRVTRWIIVGAALVGLLSAFWIRSNAQGGDVRYGDTVNGTLKADTADVWHFAGSAGDVIALNVERTSGDLEPALILQDSAEQPIAGTRAAAGQGSVSLVQIRLSQSGSYLIKVSGNGQTAGEYRLSLTRTASVPVTPSLQPTAIAATVAGSINYGDTVGGQIEGRVYRQLWRFRGTFGDIVDIRMSTTSGDLNPVLALVSPLGDTVAANDSASNGPDAAIQAFQLPFTGDYTIIARRAGSNAGQSGKTNGRYNLSLSIRGPGTAAQNTLLNPGVLMQGRLTRQVELALYRLDVGGLIAAQLNLRSLHRLAVLRFLTKDGQVLATYRGENPLTIATRLPDKGPFLVEVTSSSYEDQPFTDFGLTVFRLSASTNNAMPLRYGERRRAATSASDKWFFVGHSRDIVRLDIVPDSVVQNTTVRVIGPQDVLLYRSDLGPGIHPTLTLPDSGPYEIQVRGDDATLTYDTQIRRIGANGIAFGRFNLAMDRGKLSLDAPINGSLAAGEVDAWWLDATAGQVINLVADSASNGFAPGLALQRPDGSTVDVQVYEEAQGAVIQRVRLDQNGRYRAVVFDSKGGGGGQYTLRYEAVSGGDLQAGQSVKGILSPASGLASWSIDVSAGALINARLTTLTPKAWTPSLQVADPSGTIVASATATSPGTAVDLLGVAAPISGKYHVIVAGQVTDTLASYQLLSNVQNPFTPDNNTAIQVSTLRPEAGRYTAALTTDPVQWHVADLINPSINGRALLNGALPLTDGSTVRGEIVRGTLAQAWRIEAIHDTTLLVQANDLTGAAGPNLLLLDKDGKIVYEQLHADDPNTVMTYRVPQSGIYTLVVRMGLEGGRYLLSLSTVNLINGPLRIRAGSPLVYGQSAAGEILNGDRAVPYYFLGTANDTVSVQLSRITGDLVPGLELLSPSGRPLISEQNAAGAATLAASDVRLPESGIYVLTARHAANAEGTAGRYFLYLDGRARTQNRGGGIITPGAPVTGLLITGRNEDTWLFQGHAGERVTFTASGVGTPLPTPLGLRLQDTMGQTFAMQDVVLTQSETRLADVMLPADGVYRVQVVGGGQTAGAYSLSWTPERERLVAGPLNYGQTVSGVFTAQHRADSWVFSGTAGDVISVTMRYLRGDRFNGGFRVQAENGVPLVTVPDLGTGARADNLLLPFSGSYTLVVANPDNNFKGAGVYSLSLSLQDSKAHSLGSILRYGQDGQGSLSADDPSDTWVFGARAGDIVNVSVQAQDEVLKPALDLRAPDGTLLASALPGEPDQAGRRAVTIGKFPVQNDGVYVITITGGPQKSVGGYLLSLESVPPPMADAETINYGDTKEGLIASDRLSQTRVFSGKQGDTITARITREPGSNLAPILELWAADGKLLARADAAGQESAIIADFTLPQTGQYALVARRYLGPQGATSGRCKLALSAVVAERPIKGTVKYGQLAIGRLDDATPEDRIAFTGQKGDVIGILSRAKSGDLDTYLTLEDSAGNVLATNDDANGADAVIAGALLPADGTYTVVLSRVGTGTVGSSGNYELYVNLLYRVNATAAPKALIAYGERTVGTLDQQNPEARYTFSGNQDDEIALRLVHQTDDAPPMLELQDPAGTQLVSGTLGVGQTTIDHYRLPASGLYSVVVKRPLNAQLSYSPFALTLNLLTSPAGQSAGGVLHVNQAVTGTFAPDAAGHYWLFQGRVGQVISINLLQLNGDLLPSLLVIGPSGRSLASVAVPQRGQSVTLNQFNLPADGIYSLLVLPGGPNRAGQYRLTVQPNVPVTPAPALLAPGSPVSGTLDAVQPEQRWTFEGQKGQAVTIRMVTTGGNLIPRLTLLGPDQRVLADQEAVPALQDKQSALADFVLPADGQYVVVAGQRQGLEVTAGTYRLVLAVGALSPQAASAEPVVYALPIRKVIQRGATDLWAFNGAAGDAISITVLANADLKLNQKAQVPAISLQDAGGRVLAQATPAIPEEAQIDGVILPLDGRYVVELSASSTTGYTLIIQRRQGLLTASAPANARPLVADRPLDGAISPNTSANYWTFTGKAGSTIQISGARLDGDLRLDLTLFGPSGYVASATAGPDSADTTLGPLHLPEDGTYVLVATRWLGAAGKTGGRYSVRLTSGTSASGK
jgi:hypothetical protein